MTFDKQVPLTLGTLMYGELSWCFQSPWEVGYSSAYYDGNHYVLHLGLIAIGLYY